MENFLGEIRLMGFDRAPRGWAYCQGQTLPINQNQALFSLLGTSFGGDGVTTFKLPDLRGRVAVGQGKAPSGAVYSMGQALGSEGVTLTTSQIPAHSHSFAGTLNIGGDAEINSADSTFPATTISDPAINAYTAGTPNASMGAALQGTLNPAGGNQPHENRQPFMAMNYAIALTGIFPSRG
ncbi:tail fiber protein [Hymenobacter sp. ASUV-10]|uniref:Tail fiber protein n=1 Tax=Hymenobacter aranciens TaxID=3063996 RepID=A0ABT9BHX3_9BACT|nr:tail fiber protein [Hymenobacter sp. ASUV-10]MDO7877405.1 tail fiber protein [Hymenobacter sp. ASUV-10]